MGKNPKRRKSNFFAFLNFLKMMLKSPLQGYKNLAEG